MAPLVTVLIYASWFPIIIDDIPSSIWCQSLVQLNHPFCVERFKDWWLQFHFSVVELETAANSLCGFGTVSITELLFMNDLLVLLTVKSSGWKMCFVYTVEFLHNKHCVKSVHIGRLSGPYSVRMWKNTDQKN